MIGIKNQKFGMELEFTGITREEAAKVIAKELGTTEYYKGGTYKAWAAKDSRGRVWMVESDSSISTQGGEQCEFVTPKCDYEDIEKIQEMVRALRRNGAKVNTSCGIHIHVDAGNHNAKSLRNLLYTFRAKEHLLFKALGTQPHRIQRWCRPINDELVTKVKGIRNITTENLATAWYGGRREATWARSEHYNHTRYHALNYHSVWYRGTIEFRLFEATLHAGKIRAYINLCLAMSAQAINQKRATATELENGNDKYAMRCWLLRLGFIGDEWKTVRKHLLANLEGDSAWRNERTTYASYNRRAEQQSATA